MLGQGAFGKVYLITSKHDSNFKVAIKVLDKVKLKENICCVQEEVSILQQLDHPNIVRYYETYNDVKYVYMVMEYVDGISMFQKIQASPD